MAAPRDSAARSRRESVVISDDDADEDMAEADEMDELEVIPASDISPRISPYTHRQGSMTTPVASSSRLKISPISYRSPLLNNRSPGTYRSPVIPETPSTAASFSPSRFEASPTVSPGIRGLSVTPRNTFQPRFSASVTPTAHLTNHSVPFTSGTDIIDFTDDDDDDWGGGAVLQWDGVDLTGDSASSVAPGDAGLDSEDLEEEEGEWGREAVLDFDWEGDGGAASVVMDSQDEETGDDGDLDIGEGDRYGQEDDEEEEEEEEIESTPRKAKGGIKEKDVVRRERAASESLEELGKRGMPDYSSWDLKRLQRLCEGFGYRPSVQHKDLEKIAIACWKALNPLPAPPSETPMNTTPKPKPSKGRAQAKPRQDSASSEDVPLSAKKEKGKGKAKGKGKQKAEEDVVPIDKRFAAMVKGDPELYLRILQYAPIAFEEFVSKAIRAGIDDKGWKIALKKFLDFEGITFYTEDPTGQRRSRH